MMCSSVVGFLLLSMVAQGALMRGANKATPVGEVVRLLKGLSASVTEEGQREAKEYDKFACWCRDQVVEKTKEIDAAQNEGEKLVAQVDDLQGQITKLTAEINDLTGQISDLENELAEASKNRDKEHAWYLKESSDISAAIESVGSAINQLKYKKDTIDANVNLLELRTVATKVLEVSKHTSP
eukprot:gnl/TRDRNA2_/TRDRNA2_177696_c1_seq18.p1 gnl/TRDRNA2_/TRDRNA2_177696_c1~~gnl/TRDRNA2_/TRDRNA2_177696_c1_seq18.p1  ORF type:complete len:196 (-),score=45.17 gnl/TRDRNA2_/TRDRNA2_177696_c1_seq18:60-608(-)